MRVTRRRRKDVPLAEFPAWGIEIMMGLYGEQSVRAALAAEQGRHHLEVDVAGDPIATEIDAVSGLFRRLRRHP